MTYLTRVITGPTPQSEPLDERQAPNSAGGHSYPVDDMTRLDRFLILGSEGGFLLRLGTATHPGERRGGAALRPAGRPRRRGAHS